MPGRPGPLLVADRSCDCRPFPRREVAATAQAKAPGTGLSWTQYPLRGRASRPPGRVAPPRIASLIRTNYMYLIDVLKGSRPPGRSLGFRLRGLDCRRDVPGRAVGVPHSAAA